MILKGGSLRKRHIYMSLKNDIDQNVGLFETVTLSQIEDLRLQKRLDTKFVFENHKIVEVLKEAIKYYKVLEIEGKRSQSYETIYFDTPDLSMYQLHHRGKMNRHKVRFRKYVTSGIGFVEIKYKNNKGKTIKRRVRTSPNYRLTNGTREFIEQNTPYSADQLSKKLKVQFNRLTFVHKERQERITIDYNVSFCNLENYKDILLPNIGIVEVKRDVESDYSEIIEILRGNKIHSMGFSKYCIGMALLNKRLKKNLFKSKLRMIDRIENNAMTA